MPMGYRGAIFDVDSVLVDSPHERVRRETQLLMETGGRDIQPWAKSYAPERFAPEVYQEVVAGRPRPRGVRATLDALAEGRLERRSR